MKRIPAPAAVEVGVEQPVNNCRSISTGDRSNAELARPMRSVLRRWSGPLRWSLTILTRPHGAGRDRGGRVAGGSRTGARRTWTASNCSTESDFLAVGASLMEFRSTVRRDRIGLGGADRPHLRRAWPQSRTGPDPKYSTVREGWKHRSSRLSRPWERCTTFRTASASPLAAFAIPFRRSGHSVRSRESRPPASEARAPTSQRPGGGGGAVLGKHPVERAACSGCLRQSRAERPNRHRRTARRPAPGKSATLPALLRRRPAWHGSVRRTAPGGGRIVDPPDRGVQCAVRRDRQRGPVGRSSTT